MGEWYRDGCFGTVVATLAVLIKSTGQDVWIASSSGCTMNNHIYQRLIDCCVVRDRELKASVYVSLM